MVSSKPRKRAAKSRSRDQVKQIIRDAFRREFPHDTVDVSDGYKDNIHVMAVSRRFDKMSEQEQQELMWGIIDRSDLNEDEKSLISLLYPVSPAEIR